MIRVLIGGEFTGIMRDAFIREGHFAMSCDFKPTLVPGPHYVGNWRDIMNDGWHLVIFHPTCTYMANSSSKSLFIGGSKANGLDTDRWVKMGQAAWELWKLQQDCTAPFQAYENPIMLRYAQILSEVDDLDRQLVHPWWFGHDFDGPDNIMKATCWWTKGGLPKLQKTGTLDGRFARPDIHYMGPMGSPEERRMKRSEIAPGMAAACAHQWGTWVNERVLI